MNSLANRAHTDNAFFQLKCDLRREAIAKLSDVRVLDCFAGKNRIWNQVGCDSYFGIEKIKWKGEKNIYGDNLRIIPSLDLSRFTVIDIDSYGIPAEQLIEIVKNKTLPSKIVIIYTAIGGAISAGQKLFIENMGIKYDVYRKCPMLFNKHLVELFDRFLFDRLGVSVDRRISIIHGAYVKHYGWFELEKSAVI